jgi:hypothetical protein
MDEPEPCALCGATWGDWRQTIGGDVLKFC